MREQFNNSPPPSAELSIILSALITIGLTLLISFAGQIPRTVTPVEGTGLETPAAVGTPLAGQGTPALEPSPTPRPTKTATFTATPTPTVPTATPTDTSTPTQTPSPTPTPTPTLDLAKCNVAGCGLQAAALPTAAYDENLLLRTAPVSRRGCDECPKNEQLSDAELDAVLGVDPATLARLETIALSQATYQISPGIVYIVFDSVHHIVVDLQESGYVLRNIIPNSSERGRLITPSYCLSPNSLVVTDADYHGLNGSNKTETGRDLFYHLGRAALFRSGDRFDIDVIRDRERYDKTTISWGGGPIFLWDGRYDYNPEQEWFEPKDLEYYRDTRWAKITVALSESRKYLFITASYGLTLEEHAENIIELGRRWGIKIDRAMRFDGGESAYFAFRLGDYMVPVFNLEEPLIVNCLAIETNQMQQTMSNQQ